MLIEKEPLDDVTAIIKTFERPRALVNLVNSIRLFYPTVKAVIIDDSKNGMDHIWDKYTTYVRTEYDIGLSEGRNRALDMVKTKYTLLLDDDFVFTKKTVLEKFLAILQKTDLGLIAGNVIDEGQYPRLFRGYFELKNDHLILNLHRQKNNELYSRYDFVLNFFLAKTDALKKNKWDSRLKLGEHEEFFFRLKKKNIEVAHTDSVSVDHFPSSKLIHPDYCKKRVSRFHFYKNLSCEIMGVKRIKVSSDRSEKMKFFGVLYSRKIKRYFSFGLAFFLKLWGTVR